MQFEFPPSLVELREVTGIAEVKALLMRWIQAGRLGFNYQCMIRKNKYIYARCMKCKAYLRFKKSDNQLFLLSSFQTLHWHSFTSKRRNENLIAFINELPADVNLSTACKLAVRQLGERSSRFYYYYHKLNSSQLKFSQFVKKLDFEKYEIQYQPFQVEADTLPDLMIAVSPTMKNMYLKYGQVVGIDFTFKLIKDHHPSGKTWKVGLVVGNSLSRKIIPFALLIVLEESADSYYRLIKSFGNIMGRLPGAIVTDQSKGALSGIQQLINDEQFNGIHALDVFHILQNTKKRLKCKENLVYFSRLAACSNKNKFEVTLNQALEKMDIEDIPVLEKFVKNSHMYCLSQLSPTFFGFCPSTGSNEKIHDLIKNVIPNEKNFVTVCQRILKLSERLLQKCEEVVIQKNPLEKLYGLPELKQLRFHVDSKIMMKICQQLSEIITLETRSTQDRIFVVDMKSKSQFEIFVDQNLKYSCECSFSVKTGIFCSHIVKICLLKRERLLKYINQRWLRPQSSMKTYLTGSRPATTRRKRK